MVLIKSSDEISKKFIRNEKKLMLFLTELFMSALKQAMAWVWMGEWHPLQFHPGPRLTVLFWYSTSKSSSSSSPLLTPFTFPTIIPFSSPAFLLFFFPKVVSAVVPLLSLPRKSSSALRPWPSMKAETKVLGCVARAVLRLSVHFCQHCSW